MGKRKFNAVAVGIMTLIVALVVLMMVNNLRRTSHITLPELDPGSLADSSKDFASPAPSPSLPKSC